MTNLNQNQYLWSSYQCLFIRHACCLLVCSLCEMHYKSCCNFWQSLQPILNASQLYMYPYSIFIDWCNIWILRATPWAILWESVMALCCVYCHPFWVENIQMDGMEIFGWEPIWNVKQGLQEMSWHPAALSPQLSQISEFCVQGEIHGSGVGVEIIPDQMGPLVRLPTLRNVTVSQKEMESADVCYFFTATQIQVKKSKKFSPWSAPQNVTHLLMYKLAMDQVLILMNRTCFYDRTWVFAERKLSSAGYWEKTIQLPFKYIQTNLMKCHSNLIGEVNDNRQWPLAWNFWTTEIMCRN